MKYSDIKSNDDLLKYIQGKNKADEAKITASQKKSESQVKTIKESGTEGLKKQQEAQKAAKQAQAENPTYSQLKTSEDVTNYINSQNSAAKIAAGKAKNSSSSSKSEGTLSKVGKAFTGMFDDEGYEEKYKRGEVLGGTLSLVGEALQLPQSVLNNALANAYSLANGKGLAGWERKMDFGDYEKAVTEIDGSTPISERIGGTGGQVYKTAMEIATDPLNLLDAGTGVVAKGLSNVKSATYADLLKANKLPEHTSKVLRGTATIADDEIDDIAGELATQPQETYEEIIKAFKENGYVTDEQHARLAEIVNAKRGKNIATPKVVDSQAAEIDSVPNKLAGLLERPAERNRNLNATRKPLRDNSAEGERAAETVLGDFYTRRAAQDLEDAYDTVKSTWGTDYLTNNQIDTLLNKDSKINTRYGVNIEDKLKALDDAVFKDKNMSLGEKIRTLDETGVGRQLYGDDWDKLVKMYNGDNSQTFRVEKGLPQRLHGSALTDSEIAKRQQEIFGQTFPTAKVSPEETKTLTEAKNVANAKKNLQTQTFSSPKLKSGQRFNGVEVTKDTDLPVNRVTLTESPKAARTELDDLDDTLNAISAGESVGKIKGMFRKLYKNTVSGTAELERMAKKQNQVGAAQTANELTQALRTKTGTINTILKDKLVDKAGNVVNDKSYISLINEIPEKDLPLFNEYAQHLHNIDRWAQDKPLFKQFSADESKQKVADILAQHPEFAQYTQNINDWWRDFTQAWYVDTGIWSQETADFVRKIYPNYIPGFRVGRAPKTGDTNSILTKIGSFKKAKGGESDVIDLQDNFLALINQAVSKGRKNELYANIVETFEKYGDDFKEYGVITDAKDSVNPLDALDSVDELNMQQVRDGIYKLTAYVNGEEKSAYISKEMKDALALANDVYGGSEALKLVHDVASPLSNLRKTAITGLSPVFGTANLFRDLPTYIIQSQQSPLKATSSLFKAAKEIARKGDFYDSYKALGGTQSGYYVQGKGFSDAVKSYKKSGIDKAKDFTPFKAIEAYNETLETLPRLAEYIGLIEKYGDNYVGRLKALNGAADVTVNFSRSAPITKAADGWIMYLNAAAQGLDKFARQVKNKPIATATKSAALLTMPYATLYVINKDNPHYQDLTDRVKQNYFVIPNLSGEKDSEGYAKTFYKIPLNREFGAVMASSLDLAFSYQEEGLDGLESAAKSYKETLGTNFVPPGIEDNVLSFIGEIQNNEDYAGQKIVPTAYEDASPQYQTDANTSGIANTLAGLARQSKILPEKMKSPMNVDYALSQLGYPGQLAQAVTSQQVGTAGERAYNTVVQPFVDRFTADPRKSSGVVSKFYDELNKAETAVKDQELSGEVASGYDSPMKKYKNSLSATSKELSNILKEEKEILADNTLTKEQKKQKSNELRERRNELARNATKEASNAQKQYEKVYVKELADLDQKWQEEYQAVKGKVSATKYKAGYTAQKGVKGGDVAKALKVYDATGKEELMTQYGITESGAQKAQSLVNVQLAYEDYVKMKKNADSDGNGNIKTSEAKAYLDGSGYSRQQKAALYAALTTSKKNPYK